MDKKRIGIVIMIISLFVLGIGIGLKLGNSEMDNMPFTVIGLLLNAVGLFVLLSANKKAKD